MILNADSVPDISTTPFPGVYSDSKSALHTFSDALRMALGMFGITP